MGIKPVNIFWDKWLERKRKNCCSVKLGYDKTKITKWLVYVKRYFELVSSSPSLAQVFAVRTMWAG
jgi:hypothetical protein